MKKKFVFIGRKSIIRDVSSVDKEKYVCIENEEHNKINVNDEINSFIDLKKHVWIDESQNGHVFITGQSGSGKSFLLQKMVMQAVYRGDPIVAIDVGNCFSENHIEDMLKSVINNKISTCTYINDDCKLVIPINPFDRKEFKRGDKICKESNKDVSSRITAVLTNVLKLKEQQEATIFETIMNMMEKETYCENRLQELYEELNKQSISSAKSVASKLYKITNLVQFTNDNIDNWKDIIHTNTGKLTIFQLSDLDDNTKKLVSELILDDIIKYISLNGNKDKPFILVLDELQKIYTNDGSSIGKLLTESRKYGASLWYATQFSNFNKNNTSIQNQLEQAGTRIYLKPSDSEIKNLARQFESKNNSNDKNGFDWKVIFSSMQKGCCIVKSSLTINDSDKLVIIGSFDTPYTRTKSVFYKEE